WQGWWNGGRPSRPLGPWLLGRFRRHRAGRSELLALGPGTRQGLRVLLIHVDGHKQMQAAPVSPCRTGVAMNDRERVCASERGNASIPEMAIKHCAARSAAPAPLVI